ncbi:MAG: rhodanese-like domain-containing protein [Chlorobiaceae bacterium]|nr:rhodanese-like domain-containing protein [Chlorobiaceae bacterium]
MIQKGALLVDVREPGEIAKKAFDVPGVLQIPLRELKNRYREIPVNRRVIIACQHGNRGTIAIRFLLTQGYRKAANMQNGIVRWEKEGLPVKRKEKQQNSSSLIEKISRRLRSLFNR